MGWLLLLSTQVPDSDRMTMNYSYRVPTLYVSTKSLWNVSRMTCLVTWLIPKSKRRHFSWQRFNLDLLSTGLVKQWAYLPKNSASNCGNAFINRGVQICSFLFFNYFCWAMKTLFSKIIKLSFQKIDFFGLRSSSRDAIASIEESIWGVIHLKNSYLSLIA